MLKSLVLFLGAGLALVAGSFDSCSFTLTNTIGGGTLSCSGANSSIQGGFLSTTSGIQIGVPTGQAVNLVTFGDPWNWTGTINGTALRSGDFANGTPGFFAMGLSPNFTVTTAGTFTANYVLTVNIQGYPAASAGAGSPTVSFSETLYATAPIDVIAEPKGQGPQTYRVQSPRSIAFTATPEPATFATFGGALLAVAALARKRSR